MLGTSIDLFILSPLIMIRVLELEESLASEDLSACLGKAGRSLAKIVELFGALTPATDQCAGVSFRCGRWRTSERRSAPSCKMRLLAGAGTMADASGFFRNRSTTAFLQ